MSRGSARAAAEGVAPFELHGEVEALVEDARERVRRIEADRREHRQQLLEEVVADPLTLSPAPLLAPREYDALAHQRRQHHLVQEAILVRHHRARLGTHRVEHLGGPAAIGTRFRQPELDLLLEPSDANLEELVEVRGDDGDEAQPLEQRHRVVGRLRQHAALEREDAELAVEKLGRRWDSTVHESPAGARAEKAFYLPNPVTIP
jgi:hypothetical protein